MGTVTQYLNDTRRETHLKQQRWSPGIYRPFRRGDVQMTNGAELLLAPLAFWRGDDARD